MTAETLRRSNWPAHEAAPRRSTLEERPEPLDDPLAELERIVARGDVASGRAPAPPAAVPAPAPIKPAAAPFASNVEPFPLRVVTRTQPAPRIEPVMPVPAPPPSPPVQRTEPAPHDLFGVDEAAFEEALRGGISPEPPASRPAAQHASVDEQLAQALAATPVQPREPPPLDEAFLRDLDAELFARQSAQQRHEDDQPDDAPADPPAARPPARPGLSGGLKTVGVVLGLVVIGVGGAAAYTFFTGGARGPAGEPVVVRADARPTRIVAEPPAAPANPEANRIIYERGGQQTRPANGERVVSREEQPVDMPPRQDARGPAAAPQLSEPRRVQTTTIRVRPDGSLESEPTRAAPQPFAAAPAFDPPRAAPPAAQLVPPAGQPAAPAPLAAAPLATPAQAPAVAEPPAWMSAPATAAAPPSEAVAVPLPPSRPVRAETSAAPPPVRTAAVETSTRAPVTAQPAATGSLVQLTSQRTEEAARSAFVDLQRRYPQFLANRQPNVRAASVGERGTFYRVRIGGFGSRDDAASFCTRFRAAGGACVLTN